ncbi:MAG: hypothetical protein MK207_08350 [Saprospiraceae bacterium]|nr:hypothetical protein [Saprospiraceae bacterium]
MVPFIVITVGLIILLIIYLKKKPTLDFKSIEKSIDNESHKTAKKDLKQALFDDIVENGYSRHETSYCIKFESGKDIFGYTVEIEFSRIKKRLTTIDIDVYKEGFNIELPENVTPGFFDFVVFRNYNRILAAISNMELLPNVQQGGYFLRSSISCKDSEIPDYSYLNQRIKAHFKVFEEFQFIGEDDLAHGFFQQIGNDGYECSFCPGQMMVRFCKQLGEANYSVYYVKAMKMLFVTSSRLTDKEIQEDFSDDQTKLHHFNSLEHINKGEEPPELVFPSFEEFKEVEAEFIEEWNHYDEEE